MLSDSLIQELTLRRRELDAKLEANPLYRISKRSDSFSTHTIANGRPDRVNRSQTRGKT